MNKKAVAQIRATAQDLRKQGKKFTTVSAGRSAPTKAVQQTAKQAKQITRTSREAVKQVRSLAKVFRDAFGRFAHKPVVQPKSKKAQVKASGKGSTSVTSPGKTGIKKQPSRATPKTQTKVKQTPAASKSVKKPSKKVTSSVTPLKTSVAKQPSKSSILSTRSLKGKSGETTLELFQRLQNMGDSPDSLLKPGERWLFTYGKGRAKRLYGTFQQAVERMLGYLLSQGLLDGSIDPEENDIEQQLVTSIKIMKTSQRPKDYADKKEAETRMRENERKKIQRQARKNLADAGLELPSVFGGSIDLLEKQDALLKQREERIAQLESQLKGEKNATKRVTSTRTKGKSAKAKKQTKTNTGVSSSGKGKAGKAAATRKGTKGNGSRSHPVSKGKGKRK